MLKRGESKQNSVESIDIGRSIKIITQGNANVGKRDLLLSYTNPNYPDDYELLHEFDPYPCNHSTLVNKQQKRFQLELYDSSGLEDCYEVRKIFYRRTDVILLLYSVIDRKSFNDIGSIWYPELSECSPDAIIILVATEVSKRLDPAVIANLFLKKQRPVSREEGESLAQKIGAHRYFEVCVETHEGVWEVFDISVHEVLKSVANPSKELGLYPFFCKSASVEELELYISKKYNVNLVVGAERTSFSYAIESKNYPFAKKILEYENGIANMSNSELETVPEIIAEWINQGLIKELNLDNNNLNAIPYELTALKNISLNDNPLQSIPVEFRNAKWKKIKSYLNSVAEKTANWNIRKLILVGEEGVGKTTVAKCIGAKTGKVDTSVNLSTDGIDIQEIRIKKERQEKGSEKEFIFNTWDFGGQVVFYPTHQFFLSSGAIYLIIFDISNFKQQRIEYWMKQLKQMNGESSVIIMVGTHADQCKEEEVSAISEKLLQAFPKRLFPAFQNIIIPVSCKNGTGIKQLKETLLQLADHPSLCSIVSDSWVMLYELIKNNLESGIDYTDRETFHSWMDSCGVPPYQMPLITEFLMRTGSILNFHDKSDRNLKDLVILNPQWLARVMACLITTKGNFVTEGYLLSGDVKKIFSQFDSDIQSQIMSLLEKFKIIFPLSIRGANKYLVPSLLPSTRPSSEIIKFYPTKLQATQSCFGRIFQFGQLPLGLMGRLMISLLKIPSATGELFWRNGLLINFGNTNQIFMEYNSEEYILEIQSRYHQQHKQLAIEVWRKVLESIKTLIESFYPRLAEMKVEQIPCIHCYKSGVYKEKVYLFSYQEVDTAARNGDHFLYCNNIKSPYRSVFLSDLAPDLGMFDIPRIAEESVKIEKVLGEGGFGKVYQGIINNDTPVAIKELKLSKSVEANRSKFQEFQTECYMMNLLRHPNIIGLYGVLMNPPRMVLQLVTGGDLFQLMHQKKEDGTLISISQSDFQWERRYRISMDIAKGLHYMQSLTPPIIHRDLRSPNIFMTKEEKAIIGDFGLARIVQSGEIGGLLGTWQWVSPEALNSSSETYDQRSDIYSFGIILWEIAAIAMPFEEYLEDPRFCANGIFKTMEIKQAIVEGLRPTIPPSTPQPFAQLITQCWQSDPELRTSTSNILQTLSKLSGEKVDELIERPKVVLANNIFVSINEAEKKISKAEKIPQPISIMEIDMNSREKFSCMLLVNDVIWVASNLGSLCVFEFRPDEGFILVARKKRQKKRISQLIHVSNAVWSISDDGTVNCWNISNFSLEYEWMPLGDDSKSAATTTLFFPSNALKKCGESNIEQQVWFVSPLEGRITAWRAASKEYIKSITHEEILGAMIMEFHKGYVWVACGTSGNKICMYDAVSLDHIGSFVAHDSRITSLLSIGERIWTSSIEDIRVWDASALDTLSVYKTSKVQNSKVESMIFTGSRVLAGSFDGTVFAFDYNTVNAHQELLTADSVRCICLFQSSEMFATMSQFHLTVWPSVNDLYSSSKAETIKNALNFDDLPEPFYEEATSVAYTPHNWKKGSKGSMAKLNVQRKNPN